MLLLLPQALWVRHATPRFTAAQGATEGLATGTEEQSHDDTVETRQLLGIGDSIIAGVGCVQQTQALSATTAAALATLSGQQIHWQALGKSGADAVRILRLLQQRPVAVQPDYIVLSIGVNDVTSLKSCRRWRSDLQALLHTLRKHAPTARIAVSAVPPLQHFPALPQPLATVLGWRAAQFNQVLHAVCDEHFQVAVVGLDFSASQARNGFAADGYHPSIANYAEFGRMTARTLHAMETGN